MIAAALPDRDIAWRAVQDRDAQYDGRFVYAVSSTRIFCRPSCAARRPTKARVEFFASAREAEAAGYRACRRCRPVDEQGSKVQRAIANACAFLSAHTDEPVTLAALASEVGVSAFHLQRAFKRALGVSPREYHDAERRRRLTKRLRQGDTVSRATYEAGFGSSSRVYERAADMGMTPSELRKRGAGQKMQFSIVASPLGRLIVAYTERGVCAVALGDDDQALEGTLRADFAGAVISRAGPALNDWIARIVATIDGTGDASAIPIDARGTAFQWRVWRELQRIPRGTTLSYSQVAERIGQPTAARAVARACATNPVALVVPCHRVIREDGSLGGYRWGMERKERLLDSEQGR